MFDTPFIIPVVAILGWVAVTWIRAQHGLDRFGRTQWREDGRNVNMPPMFEKLLNRAMEERDQQIEALRERVETLEKIVIDSHKSRSLSEEIDRLRDSQR